MQRVLTETREIQVGDLLFARKIRLMLSKLRLRTTPGCDLSYKRFRVNKINVQSNWSEGSEMASLQNP